MVINKVIDRTGKTWREVYRDIVDALDEHKKRDPKRKEKIMISFEGEGKDDDS